MGVIYERADVIAPEVCEMAREIIESHHPELRLLDETWATVAILMATNGDKESDEPPLKDGAYPVVGQIKPVPYVQRVDGRRDAEIRLDRKRWDNMTEPQQRATLDHLISFLEVDTDQHGFVKTDDAGRPRLRIKAADWFLKGFRHIARRYGSDSPEVIAARQFEQDYGDVLAAGEKLFA